ncbi:MAG: site-2 protease family protein [Deinococcota bacterium]
MILDYLRGRYSPSDVVIVAIIMIFALMFHNVVQAWVAAKLGDASPKFSGYLNFDPPQHLEPIGVVLLFIFGLGWPKQVPVNSRNYPGRGRKEALVWYSGPAAYLLVAFVCVLLAVIVLGFNSPQLANSFIAASSVAIYHAVLNLIPVYPLDGAKAAIAWGNADVRRLVRQVASYGFIGFIVVFMLLSYTGIIRALEAFFFNLLVRIVGFLVGGF